MTDTPLCVFPRTQKVMILSPDTDLVALFGQAFSPAEIDIFPLPRGRGAIEHLFNDPPDLLVVDQNLTDIPGLVLVSMVKSENVYRQLPVALVMDAEALANDVDWCSAEVDELLVRPLSAAMVFFVAYGPRTRYFP